MIRPITSQQTYSLRHRVLWPDKPIEFVRVPEDAFGFHFGYFIDNEPVAVISLFFDEQNNARFRKFATHPEYQRQGIGSQLLHHVFEKAADAKASRIWCDARLEAKPFYERFGMQQQGELFYKGEIPYVKMTREF
ncbi:MAG: GNAT family N-acetyltransferase [Spirosomataceae bacterium]